MKLNPDCVRDILLIVESLPDLQHFYRFDETTCPQLFHNIRWKRLCIIYANVN